MTLTRRGKAVVTFGILGCLILIPVVAGYVYLRSIGLYGSSDPGKVVEVKIPKGAGTNTIGQILEVRRHPHHPDGDQAGAARVERETCRSTNTLPWPHSCRGTGLSNSTISSWGDLKIVAPLEMNQEMAGMNAGDNFNIHRRPLFTGLKQRTAKRAKAWKMNARARARTASRAFSSAS